MYPPELRGVKSSHPLVINSIPEAGWDNYVLGTLLPRSVKGFEWPFSWDVIPKLDIHGQR
jgi:hypothetical protein